MVFKKILQRFGVGGPSVDTILDRADVQPGGMITGHVNVIGGDHDVDIDEIALSLVVRAESEAGDEEYSHNVDFAHTVVNGAFALAAGQEFSLPFQMQVPWSSPITHVYGQPLHGMEVGVRTELAVAKAIDKGDLDPLRVHPLASQEAVLQGFEQLGFGFKTADVETGRIAGLNQELPFFQEIEYFPPQTHVGRVSEIELTFVADGAGVNVVLEADRRGGIFGGGGDTYGRFTLSHVEAENHDWAGAIATWLDHVAASGGGFGHVDHGHHDAHESSGFGGMVAGAALGVAGGLVAGEVLDEVFEDEEDED